MHRAGQMDYRDLAFVEQRGAVEACWAHNPEVGGSKPLAAKIVFAKLLITPFPYFALHVSTHTQI